MKLSKIISPERLRWIAEYLYRVDKSRGFGYQSDEVQQDLRQFANELEKQEAAHKRNDTFIQALNTINKVIDTIVGAVLLYFVVKICLFPGSLSEWMYELFLSHLDKSFGI